MRFSSTCFEHPEHEKTLSGRNRLVNHEVVAQALLGAAARPAVRIAYCRQRLNEQAAKNIKISAARRDSLSIAPATPIA
ncbi:MAG: hypothetical protein U0836_24175, partial [Pirellulales bacterium]